MGVLEQGFEHEPVLVNEVVEHLNPRDSGVYFDGTVGGGGHAEAILRHAPGARYIGVDRDPQAIQASRERLAPFGERVTLTQGNFQDLETILSSVGVGLVDGVLLDLGVSSHQLDVEARGFSYWGDAPLDMRMGPDAPQTAAELVAGLDVGELTRIFQEYGEERFAARIARAIVERRAKRPIQTTSDLAELVKNAIPAAARRKGPHPARRVFQALRIAVNDELGALNQALEAAVRRLTPGGRLVVISFHSLEDRVVKHYFVESARDCICPPEVPECRCETEPTLRIITRRPVTPQESEINVNPRARSAKLRAAERVLAEGASE